MATGKAAAAIAKIEKAVASGTTSLPRLQAISGLSLGKFRDLMRAMEDSGRMTFGSFRGDMSDIRDGDRMFVSKSGALQNEVKSVNASAPLPDIAWPDVDAKLKADVQREIERETEASPQFSSKLDKIYAKVGKPLGVTVGQYQDAIADLTKEGRLRLTPWTASRGELASEHAADVAIPMGAEIKFYARATGKGAPAEPEKADAPAAKTAKPAKPQPTLTFPEKVTQVQLSPSAKKLFPWLKGATEYVQQMGVATPKQFKKLATDVKLKTFTVDGVNSIDTLSKMRDTLKDAIAKGESRETFKKKLDDIATTKAGEAERILRTTSKAAYMDQWSKTQDRPAVKRAFGYVVYRATRDGRTRPWHRALDGFCCSVDDPAYKVLLEIQAEYNCRCILTALTETQAKRIGIKTSKDLPNISALRSAA